MQCKLNYLHQNANRVMCHTEKSQPKFDKNFSLYLFNSYDSPGNFEHQSTRALNIPQREENNSIKVCACDDNQVL